MKIFNRELFTYQPACVLLDLDNTLYSYEEAHIAGMQEILAVAADLLDISARDFRNCYDDARSELKNRIGHTASSHNRLIYLQRAVERAGFATQPQIVMQLEQSYWRAFMGNAELFPEAVDFLDDLRMAGIPSVLVTDQTLNIQLRKMIHLDIDGLVEWVVTSEEVGADKPNPANFEIALAKLGGVEGQVWMVGDDFEKDIVGAKQAIDATTMQKVSKLKYAGGINGLKPDAAFTDFSDLRSFFRQLKPLIAG